MKRHHKKTLASLLIFTIALSQLVATRAVAFPSDTPWAGKEKLRPGMMSGPERTDIFTDYFMPFGGNSDSLYFLDVNVRTDDEDSSELNVGLGYRVLGRADTYLLGANVFYDIKDSEFDNTFTQVGFGFEAMTKHFDLRANHYHPLGSTEKQGEKSKYKFAPSSLLVDNGYEEALIGTDAEIGVLIPYLSDYIEARIFGGVYDYTSERIDTDDVDGKRFRLELRPSEMLTLNAEYYDENSGETSTVAGAYLNLPFSVENLVTGANPFEGFTKIFTIGQGTRPLRQRLTDKVERDRHIIIVKDDYIEHKEVIYVNQDNPTGGNGTQDNPYKTLAGAAFDGRYTEDVIVYITSTDNIADTYNTNLILPNGAELWGDSVEHPIYELGGTGPRPILNGGGGTIVTLGDDNIVTGLQFTNGDYGIYGAGVYNIDPTLDTSIYKTLIEDNIIDGMSIHGVYVENYYNGADDVSDLTFDINIKSNEIINNNFYGTYVYYDYNGTGNYDNITINNNIIGNTFNGNDEGLIVDTYLYTSKSATDINITNNIEDNIANLNTSDGLYIDNGVDANATYATSQNTINVSGTITNNFINNEASLNGGDGIIIDDNFMQSSLKVNSDTITENLTVNTDGIVTNYFKDNITNNNGLNGISIIGTNLSTTGRFGNSDITGDIRVTTEGSIENYFENNISNENGEHGIVSFSDFTIKAISNLSNGSTLIGNNNAIAVSTNIQNTFINNTIDSNNLSGINLAGSLIKTDNLNRSNSTIEGSILSTTSASYITNTFTGNSSTGVTTNSENGIVINKSEISSTATLQDGNTTLDGSIQSNSTSAKINTVLDNNNTSGNLGTGIHIKDQFITSTTSALPTGSFTASITAVFNGSAITNTVTSNTSSDNGGYGILFGDNTDLNIEGNIISSSATLDGASVSLTNGGVYSSASSTTITNDFSNNITNSNIDDGIYIENNAILSDSQILNGVVIDGGSASSTIDSASIVAIFDSNTSLSNGGSGIAIGDQYIYSSVYSQSSDRLTGAITSTISNSQISNTAQFNTASENGNYGIAFGDGLSANDSGNLIASVAEVDGATIILTNGELSSSTESSSINSNFSNNISNLNGSDGIYSENDSITSLTVASNGALIEGEVTSLVTTAGVTVTASNNESNLNGGSGILINDMFILSQLDIAGATVTGTLGNDSTASFITAHFDSNITMTNGVDGIHVGSESSATLTGSTLTNFTVIDNQIIGNTNYGLTTVHAGSDYSGTVNSNSIFGNAAFDLFNGVNTSGDSSNHIDATENWWGADTNPSVAGFLGGDPIDYTPWSATPLH